VSGQIVTVTDDWARCHSEWHGMPHRLSQSWIVTVMIHWPNIVTRQSWTTK